MKVLPILSLLLVVFSINLIAQDTIYTKDNQEIIAKILEVDKTSITYKKFDYQDGPSFTIEKSELVKIMYQNGDLETFTTVVEKPSSPTLDAEPIMIVKKKNKDKYYIENKLLLVNDLKYQLLKYQNHPQYETIKLNISEYEELFKYGRKKKRNVKIARYTFLASALVCGVTTAMLMPDWKSYSPGNVVAPILAGAFAVGFGISYKFSAKGQTSLNKARDKMEETITLYNSGL